jgi:hypothetical protein
MIQSNLLILKNAQNALNSEYAGVRDATSTRPRVAEGVRFELTKPFGSPVFKTGAINRSATLPFSHDKRGKALDRESRAPLLSHEVIQRGIDRCRSLSLIRYEVYFRTRRDELHWKRSAFTVPF